MMKIAVAMTTFNGARYLGEQLDSLVAQTLSPSQLVICDDGSTDETLELLDEFSRHAPFPVEIHRNETNLGYADNFFKAAGLCKGDWVAFCDQDDIWLPTKLAKAASAIEANPGLSMVLQNADLCDADGKSLGERFPDWIRPGVYGSNQQYAFWVWPGFLKTFRQDLIDNLDTADRPVSYSPDFEIQSHDKWTCMIANALGGICILDEPVARYRRHQAALTGSNKRRSLGTEIARATRIGAAHYERLVRAASTSSQYLRRAAASSGQADWQLAFETAAGKFDQVARIQARRARLYDQRDLGARLRAFIEIWRLGGYLGDPFTAMGGTSALKDAVAVSGWLR